MNRYNGEIMKTTDPGFTRLLKINKTYHEMSAKERNAFYQSKCEYYEYAVKFAIIGTCLASIGYLVSDYQLNGNNIWPTLIPRLSIIIPMFIYTFISRHVKDRKKVIFMDFLMCHMIIWTTIWAVYHLDIKVHFSEGSIVMNLIMLTVGFAASPLETGISYLFFFVDILVSDMFNHYPNLDIILSLNIPCCLAIIFGQYILNFAYLDHYLTGLKLENIMVMDQLTGVYNRRKLERLIQEDRLFETEDAVSIAMLDIDLFKNVNDTYGHYVGDKVLAYLGKTLMDSVGEKGYVIRFGGEEFLIVLNGADIETAASMINAVREQIADAADAPVHFTVSAGVALYSGDFDECEKNADQALYGAKERGRNCVYIWQGDAVK